LYELSAPKLVRFTV